MFGECQLRRACVATFIASCFVLTGCEYLYPDQGPEVARDDKELHFEPSYYAKNAKEYFGDGHYGKAKQQWQHQLKLEDNWMARLGVASCDFHMGSLNIDLGDLKGGRTKLQQAEAAVRKLWDGSIEEDTRAAADAPVRQWQAALILAMTHRALGDCDNMESRIITQRLASLRPGDARIGKFSSARQEIDARRGANVRQATSLLKKLCDMQNPSERASLNYAEILASKGEHGAAEKHFQDYLAVAKASVTIHEQNRKATVNMEGTTSRKEFLIQQFDQKIASANTKRAAILVRLGNIHFDDGAKQRKVANDAGQGADLRTRARDNAKDHFAQALSYLRDARGLEPESLHVLVKMAQCEGELGFFEAAILNLKQYIRICAEQRLQADENIHRAYRMKSEFERKLNERRNGK